MPLSQRPSGRASVAALRARAHALLLPAAAPAAAADPVVLTRRHDAGPRRARTRSTRRSSSATRRSSSPTTCWSTSTRTRARPGLRRHVGARRRRQASTFHIRDGMKWSDGEPATSEDACFSWGLAIAAIKDDANIGAGYLDPSVKDAGVTKVECPDAEHVRRLHDRPVRPDPPGLRPDPAQAHLGQGRLQEDRRREVRRPARRHRPVHARRVEDGPVRALRPQPELLGPEGLRGRGRPAASSQTTRTRWSRRSRRASSTTRTTSNPDQFKQLQADPAYTAVAGKANGWTQLAFNTYGTGTGKTIQGGGPSTKALLDPAFRDALGYAVDKQTLVDRVLGGFGDVGHDRSSRRSSADWHVEPDKPRTFDIELAKQKLDAAGYTLDASGKRLDKEASRSSLRLVHPGLRRRTTPRPRSSSRTGTASWDQGHRPRSSTATRSATSCCRRRPRRRPPSTTSSSGAGRATRTRTTCSRSSAATRSAARPTASTATRTTTRCTTSSSRQAGDERKATLAQMQNLIYDQAPYDILYYDANLDVLSHRQVRGLAEQARNGTPFFTYGDLNYTLLTDATPRPTAAPEAPAASAAAARPPATPAPSAGPEQRLGQQQRTRCLVGGRARARDRCRRRRARREPAAVGDRWRRRVAGARTTADEARRGSLTRPSPSDRAGRRPWAPATSRRKVVQAFVTILAIVVLNFLLFRLMPGSPERAAQEPAPHPRRSRRRPRDAGASTSRSSRTSSSRTSKATATRRPRVLDQVPRPAGDRRLAPRSGRRSCSSGSAEIFAIIVGLALGAYAGWKRGGKIDSIGNGASLILYSMPYFVIGMPLIIVFAAGLGWFPTSGMSTPGMSRQPLVRAGLGPRLAPRAAPGRRHARPASAATRSSCAPRSSTPAAEDYITTARAKGLADGRILRSHAFPNALLPMVTLIAINLGYVIAGAITAEIVFSWPGLGTLTIHALERP